MPKCSALVEAMVEVDRIGDHLKEIEKASFHTPQGHPDLDPPHEALMLAEQFREATRSNEAKSKGEAFVRAMLDASQTAEDLVEALRSYGRTPPAIRKDEVEAVFARLNAQCTACHRQHRDNKLDLASPTAAPTSPLP